jgi:HEAT repeat protein
MRPRILIGIAVILAAAAAVFFLVGGSDDRGDPNLAQIDKLREKRDIPALAAKVSDSSEVVARHAVGALARLGPGSLPEIRKAMQDPRPGVREAAATGFAQVGRHEEGAPLVKLVREDESANVRAAAVSGLDRMCAFDEMETIIAAMDDPDVIVRRRAGKAATRFACADVGFRADDPPDKRQAAIERMRALWREEKDRARRYWTAYIAQKQKKDE